MVEFWQPKWQVYDQFANVRPDAMDEMVAFMRTLRRVVQLVKAKGPQAISEVAENCYDRFEQFSNLNERSNFNPDVQNIERLQIELHTQTNGEQTNRAPAIKLFDR